MIAANLELELFILGTVFIIALSDLIDLILDLLEEILGDLGPILLELALLLWFALIFSSDWVFYLLLLLLITLFGLWVALKILNVILRAAFGKDTEEVDKDDTE